MNETDHYRIVYNKKGSNVTSTMSNLCHPKLFNNRGKGAQYNTE